MLAPLEQPIALGGDLQKKFELNPKQLVALRLMAGPQTHTCLVGGSRSGKTFLIVRAIVIRGLRAAHSRHLMVRFRANALRASVWLDTFPKVMRLAFPGVGYEEHRQDGYFLLPNGSQIWGGGLDESDRVEKILGQEYATIYAGECSQIPYSSILVLRTRLAQMTSLKLRSFYDLNPTSTQHWTNLEFGEHLDPINKTKLRRPEQFERCFLNPHDNKDNLPEGYLESLDDLPEQYQIRFRDGKYSVDIDGALWTADSLELSRVDPIDPDPAGKKLGEFQRIAIGVDPSGAKSKADIKSDEIGIVVAGRRADKTGAILEDASLRGSPAEWGKRVAAMWKKWKADIVVGEANYGGAMVESTMTVQDPSIKVVLTHASRGKEVRAEPISHLFDNKRVGLAGRHPKLEEQLVMFSKFGYQGDRSPDRADAGIWALTELFVDQTGSYTLGNVR